MASELICWYNNCNISYFLESKFGAAFNNDAFSTSVFFCCCPTSFTNRRGAIIRAVYDSTAIGSSCFWLFVLSLFASQQSSCYWSIIAIVHALLLPAFIWNKLVHVPWIAPAWWYCHTPQQICLLEIQNDVMDGQEQEVVHIVGTVICFQEFVLVTPFYEQFSLKKSLYT